MYSQRTVQPILFGLRIGIVLFPSCFLLDWFSYPQYKYYLLIIRIATASYFVFSCFLLKLHGERVLNFVMCSCFFLAACSITLMCVVVGEGFASPYRAGIMQVLIISVLLFYMRPFLYRITVFLVALQYFAVLAFLPFTVKDFLSSFFAIGITVVMAILIHYFMKKLLQEIKTLKGIIPICARCKRIRDDRGYWHQLESFIRNHSDAEFSHSLCIECAKELYPDIYLEK